MGLPPGWKDFLQRSLWVHSSAWALLCWRKAQKHVKLWGRGAEDHKQNAEGNKKSASEGKVAQ